MEAVRNVLFINTNRYRNPPVMPIGIEHVAHALRAEGFEVRVLDLCFSDDPEADIREALAGFRADACCLSIRNVDTVLWPDPEFFLPEVRDYIRLIRELSDAPVIIGGSALLAGAGAVAGYLGADVAIVGPGEGALPALLKDPAALAGKGAAIDGHFRGCYPATGRAFDLSYEPYTRGEGIAGFMTHKGCSAGCVYCIEAGTPVSFREPSEVAAELRKLASMGLKNLHLCDSEFNEDFDYSSDVLKAMEKEGLDIRWSLYMKPGYVSQRFMKRLHDTGAYLITLAVDTYDKCPEYWSDIEKMLFIAKRTGIRTAIDLLSGFPYEDEGTLREALDFFRRVGPDEVVVNTHIRLYKNIAITKVIESDESLGKYVRGAQTDDGSYLSPVFYSHVAPGRLKELIDGDRLFRVAGEEKVVNYQRA